MKIESETEGRFLTAPSCESHMTQSETQPEVTTAKSLWVIGYPQPRKAISVAYCKTISPLKTL